MTSPVGAGEDRVYGQRWVDRKCLRYAPVSQYHPLRARNGNTILRASRREQRALSGTAHCCCSSRTFSASGAPSDSRSSSHGTSFTSSRQGPTGECSPRTASAGRSMAEREEQVPPSPFFVVGAKAALRRVGQPRRQEPRSTKSTAIEVKQLVTAAIALA